MKMKNESFIAVQRENYHFGTILSLGTMYIMLFTYQSKGNSEILWNVSIFQATECKSTIEFTTQWVMVLMNNSLALDMDCTLYELLVNNGLNM